MERQESDDETQHSGLPTTSTPKKHGARPVSHDNIQISPVKSSQQTQASQEEFDVDSYLNFLHNDKTAECSQRSTISSWQDEYTKCDICHTCCRIASHLRRSKDCLAKLKSQHQFQFHGSKEDEVFTVKIALIIGECPSPCCPTGRHPEIPQDCVEWWKSDGWDTMKWRGDRQNADKHIIKEKIRDFVKNHRKKSNQHGEAQHGTQASQSSPRDVPSSINVTGRKCSSCGEDGDTLQHLYASFQCREAYAKHCLTDDEVDIRRTIFQLSIVLNVCARLECTERTGFIYLGTHLNRNKECLEFYQSEGVYLAIWNPSASSQIISKRIAQMRRMIKQNKQKEHSFGYVAYKKELMNIMDHVCCKCGTMGPLVGKDCFVLRGGWTDADGEKAWFCPNCTEESLEYADVKQKLRNDTEKLKGPRNSQNNDMKVVRSSASDRLIVAPVCLTEDSEEVSEVVPSLSTRILVPHDASALRALMTCCDGAVEDKSELKKCMEDILSRPFITSFEDSFSCLYRSFLAEVRHKMKIITMAISKNARGEVVSLNPNVTSARKRNPNLEMTMEGALRDLCAWSLPHRQHKSLESEARAHINGKVKIHMRGTIIKDFEDEDLRRILLLGCKEFAHEDMNSFEELANNPGLEAFITKMAPVILKYVRAKVKLFIKHIVSPNFSNYDLRLEIADHGLNVQIQGYLYAKQLTQVNKMLAKDPQLRILPEITSRVTKEEEVLPTTALNWERLTTNYKIEELRARNIVEIAQRCQIGDVVFPLSLLNIWTPSEWIPSENEKVLRFRVEQLSHERNHDENTEEAIIDITHTLLEEGLFEELASEEIDQDILQSMKRSLVEVSSVQDPSSLNALMWFHTLLLRTGGNNQWTLRRQCGATLVIPYHPLLLEALGQQVEARIAINAEHLKTNQVQCGSEVMAGFAWRDVSVLNFLHGISLDKYDEPVSQFTVSVIASQEQEFTFKESNEKDEECDDIFINSKGDSFIITNGDLRKLYVKRPPAMQWMTFAQFVTSYYRKTSRQQAIIDPQTDVGQESEELIVGGGGLRAPLSMKLSNTIIMKKRSEESKPIPVLLQCNTLNSYGERMLFQPWRSFEELVEDQNDEDKATQQQNRLKLFPLSIFPKYQ